MHHTYGALRMITFFTTSFNLIAALIITYNLNVSTVNTTNIGYVAYEYSQLIKANHLTNPPRLVIINADIDNAYSDGRDIVVYTGLLKHATYSNVAFVLGHELGHHYLQHKMSNWSNEYAADKAGYVYAEHAGYNACKAADILKSWPDSSKSHPGGLDRYKALGC